MYEAVQTCKQCGAKLTLDDMRKTNCAYCGTVFPHHSQAAQHAQVVGQVMNQMMAQQAQVQDAWRAQFGVGPGPGAPGAQPPQYFPPMQPGAPGSPYADPAQIAAASMAHVGKMSRTIMTIVLVSVVGTILLTAGIVAFALMSG